MALKDRVQELKEYIMTLEERRDIEKYSSNPQARYTDEELATLDDLHNKAAEEWRKYATKHASVCWTAKLYLGDNPQAGGAHSHGCHAFLSSGYRGWDELVNFPRFFPDSRVKYKGEVTEETVKLLRKSDDGRVVLAFYDWLINDEVFGQCFWTSDVEDYMLRGSIINADTPQAICQTALITSRLPYEYPHRVQFWHELVKRGAPPRGALVLAQAYIRSLVDGRHQLGCSPSNHQMFSVKSMSRVDYRSLVAGDTRMRKTKDYRTMRKTGYHNVNMFWCRSRRVNSNKVAWGYPEHPENIAAVPAELFSQKIKKGKEVDVFGRNRGEFIDVGFESSMEKLVPVAVRWHEILMSKKSS